MTACSGCNPLPSLENAKSSAACPNTAGTPLGAAVAPRVEAHPGCCGIHALPNAFDAFAARMLLAQVAERSLDAQYYIWHADLTGTMLFQALRAAADRNVRVRLLLDDNRTVGLDRVLAALDSHPNIEVRLFNPFRQRKFRVFGYLSDFSRLNRRMHNKSFTADKQATIIGGRNIGDEYFDAAAAGTLTFSDLDVLAVGPVVDEVSSDFDRYWASASSCPAGRVLAPATPKALADLAAAAAAIERDPAAAAYLQAIENSRFVGELLEGSLTFEWAPTRVVSDDPAKGLGRAKPESLILRKLMDIVGEPVRELDLVSPYFVPTAAGVDTFAAMAKRGAQIRILVNSLAATDVRAVHSGYAKRRKALLEAGVTLYEMRLVPADTADKGSGVLGSSASSVHAKTFAVDRSRIFIGSFNFDPRSANLNTELGFVIESPELAAKLAEMFDSVIPAAAYRVHLSNTGKLYWTEQRDGREVRHDTEPGTSVWQRAAVTVLSWLPIEWLL
jgi:cardiolipin synthase C